jgi:hypothetical protein
MKMLVKGMALATSVALVMLFAAEAANAKEYLSHEAAHVQSHHVAPGPHAAPPPNAAMSGNRQIGTDPDPFIREEMLRHSNSGWPD